MLRWCNRGVDWLGDMIARWINRLCSWWCSIPYWPLITIAAIVGGVVGAYAMAWAR